MLVDSHCHLDFDVFGGRLADVLAGARAAGIGTMLTIGTKLKEFPGVRAIAEGHPDIFCSVGVHPHEAGAHDGLSAADLVALATHPRVVGLGETGLDYHYQHSSPDAQRACFGEHLEAAQATGLPVIVHSRNADTDTAEMLEAAAAREPLTGVIHCFTGGAELARRCIDIGFHISFSGIVTFKNADDLRETARQVPLDRLLVETDAPYLAPVPNRGKPNEPAFVVHTAARLAEIRGITLPELADATTSNFFALFGKAERPAEAPVLAAASS
jgi:TatD DNase family protein